MAGAALTINQAAQKSGAKKNKGVTVMSVANQKMSVGRLFWEQVALNFMSSPC
jgi:hypothetical protein